MAFCHDNRKVSKTKVGTKMWAVAVTDLVMLVLEEYGRWWDIGLGKL